VLPLWRDKVRIALSKDRLIILQHSGGRSTRILSKAALTYPESDSGWQPALEILETALKSQDWKKAEATLILSSHFVRFLVLPWNEARLSVEEQMALVQHRFDAVYGEASAGWEFRLNEGSFGAPSIACAIPQDLLNQLKTVFNASTLRLKFVQPYLMTAFNACRSELGNEASWFVLAERDNFCIGLLQSGHWSSIRVRRVISNWFEEAMLLLEREAMLAGGEKKLKKVYVFAPEMAVSAPIKRDSWLIQRLKLNPLPELSQMEMASYAMAVAGL
jgi:hypothetical protein